MQRYFKTLFITIVPFILSFCVCYLIGSFIEVSFDTVLRNVTHALAQSLAASCGALLCT